MGQEFAFEILKLLSGELRNSSNRTKISSFLRLETKVHAAAAARADRQKSKVHQKMTFASTTFLINRVGPTCVMLLPHLFWVADLEDPLGSQQIKTAT